MVPQRIYKGKDKKGMHELYTLSVVEIFDISSCPLN